MSGRSKVRRRRTLALLTVLFCLPAAMARADHPLALWHVVHDLCVPVRRLTGLSLPCEAVHLQRGYAVVPDPGAPDDILIVPTARVTGIEDPQLLKPGAPNYWAFAWDERRRLARRLGVEPPRDMLAMAVNAIPGRSQDQLHIHLSCVRRDVLPDIAQAKPAVGDSWSTVTIGNQPWRVRSLASADLKDQEPFKLMAFGDVASASELGLETLVVVGARLPSGQPGFYLLHRAADPQVGDMGHGERLLDESCSAIRAPR